MDELALQYLEIVLATTKQANILSNAPKMIDELKRRIALKNSYVN